MITVMASDTSSASKSIPATAADCVNTGLSLFQSGDSEGALTLFKVRPALALFHSHHHTYIHIQQPVYTALWNVLSYTHRPR